MAYFNCSKCGFSTKVPDVNAGKKGKCPKCGHITIISENPPPEKKTPEEYSYDDRVSEDYSESEEPEEEEKEVSQQSHILASGMKECPICGEHIRVKARKCRYCGEIIDRGLAKAKKREKHRDMMRRRRTYAGPREVSSAKSSLICGILSLICVLGIVLGPMAIFLGISAHSEIKKRRGEATGGGMATAGIVLGIIATIGWIIILATIAAE